METQAAQETSWLEAAERHIQEHLRGGEAEKELITSVWLQCTRLPVSYSFTAISQLLALQRSPCVSLLGWGTEQFQQWSREGLGRRTESGGAPPTTLPRARLLLAGYITDLPDDGNREQDGNLYLQDASGCVPCEISQFDCSGLGSLYFIPCWTFIPTHQTGGYVEVLSPPIPVPKVRALVPVNSSLLTPVSAFLLLGDSSHPRGSRVAVIGKLSSVTSLVTIRSKTFFFFFLQHGKRTIPVIVHVPSKLFWFRVLAVGETYEVSSLSLSSLGGSPRRVFAVTSSSILALRPPLSPPFSSTPDMDNSEELTEPGESLAPDCGPQERVTGRRSKEAKTLTYKGVVTRVLNAPAGLYELDGALLLCTAYTQLQNGGRGMRVGARVEVCDAHLQQTPSPLFSSLVLSCCLRSRIQICDFSRLAAPCALFSGSGNLYLQLLFRYRLRLPEFLWACDVIDKLQEKLCPRLVRQNCVTRAPTDGAQGPAEKLLFPTISAWPDGRRERDLQEEMVAEPHDCPLRQYSPLPPPWSLPPLSLVPSLVSSTQKLPGEESNRRLHWSHHSVRSRDLSPPQVLLGVLQASSSSGSLILKDQSSSLSCLVLPAPPISWIGCVLAVRDYHLVTETIKVKDDDEDLRSKTYAVFLAQDVTILHSSHSSSSSCPVPGSGDQPPVKIPRLETSWPQRHLVVESLEGRHMRHGHDKGLQFRATASWVDIAEAGGEARKWDKGDPKVILLFSSSSVRWFHFLRPNRVYRLTATGEMDSGIFDGVSAPLGDIVRAPRCLQVPADWILEDVEGTVVSPGLADVLSIEEALVDSSSGSLLTVSGVVSSRAICDTQRTVPSNHDGFLPPGASIKVTLTQPQSQSSASVYLDVSGAPYCLGLLPGAAVTLRGLERKVSRSGRVYLRSVPTTHVSVVSPPSEDVDEAAAPPLVLFRHLTGTPTPQCALCSVTCVLNMTLHWDCALCGGTFMQGACERSPSCTSQSGVFRAKAWVKVEDGSGEARLYLQDEAVSVMLGVSRRLWEALQGRVLSQGKVMVKSRGRSEMPGEEDSRDPLVDHVTLLMTRPAISRPLLLTFRQRVESVGAVTPASQLTRFTRGEREYVTRVPAAPVVTCVQLQEAEPRTLCHMIRDRSQSAIS